MSNEIEAARIAADAAIRAARVQGEWTLAAGVFAFLGGLLAIAGAVIAARIQVRLEHRKHNALVSAYRTRMVQIVEDISDHAFCDKVHIDQSAAVIRMEPFAIPEELSPSNWRDHAMLGHEEMVAVRELYKRAKAYHNFFEQMHGKPADANSERFGDKRAIDAYRHLNQSLSDKTEKLRSALKPQRRCI